MKEDELGVKSMIGIAEKLGQEVAELEERNKRRRAKGRKPLPDRQSKMDEEVLRTQYRTKDYTTVDGAQALALYEKRKALMMPDDDLDEEEERLEEIAKMSIPSKRAGDQSEVSEEIPPPVQNDNSPDVEKAVREAEAVRRAQDMKAGRINHESNWSDGGQKLEGGDSTELPSTKAPSNEEPHKPPRGKQKAAKGSSLSFEAFAERMDDLYVRLKTSFEGLEVSLSDLQGRVAEIVTASTPQEPVQKENEMDEFKAMLDMKTPVTFNVLGTQLEFDAITVFHAPPCITVVSKIGSAKVMPKPGARLLLTYEMDGHRYENDPVTFLGTRFDLPMFGLSFVGFIRDNEADLMDVDSEHTSWEA